MIQMVIEVAGECGLNINKGKGTYWKSMVQPRVLSAAAVVVWTKKERKQLQRVENRVWRLILEAQLENRQLSV